MLETCGDAASQRTLSFYDDNAQSFIEATAGVDLSSVRDKFLAYVPPGGHILDAGCGSGRDTWAFLAQGYQVTAIDGSGPMAKLAAQAIGHPVSHLRFEDMAFEQAFDGIWCCAALLHIPHRMLDDVLGRFIRSLRPGGVFYASFKPGAGESFVGGRLFSYHTRDSLMERLARFAGTEVIDFWVTADPTKKSDWLNVLVRKNA